VNDRNPADLNGLPRTRRERPRDCRANQVANKFPPPLVKSRWINEWMNEAL
jgi:hypothetical protein